MKKLYRTRKAKDPYKTLTEGEPYCPVCFKHIDACQCLEVLDVPDDYKPNTSLSNS